MSIDHKILEQRLITKDSVLAAPSLSKCATKLSLLKASITDKATFEAFMRELILFKIESDKACKVHESYSFQRAEYEGLERLIKDKTLDTKEEIDFLKEKLRQEKEIRKHRLKVEEFAVEVNKHKSRSYLKRKISDIEESLNTTNDNLRQIDTDILARKTQFDALLNALLNLESQLILEKEANEDNDSDNEGGERDQRNSEENENKNESNEQNQYDDQTGGNAGSMQIDN